MELGVRGWEVMKKAYLDLGPWKMVTYGSWVSRYSGIYSTYLDFWSCLEDLEVWLQVVRQPTPWRTPDDGQTSESVFWKVRTGKTMELRAGTLTYWRNNLKIISQIILHSGIK